MIEKTILTNLITNTPYLRKVIPFLKQEYFHEPIEREIFLEIDNYVTKYSDIPSKEALVIGIDEHKNISDEMYSKIMGYIDSIEPTDVNQDWLVDETESFVNQSPFTTLS